MASLFPKAAAADRSEPPATVMTGSSSLTPAGKRCFECEEPILEGEQGDLDLMANPGHPSVHGGGVPGLPASAQGPAHHRFPEQNWMYGRNPRHRECSLRAVISGIGAGEAAAVPVVLSSRPPRPGARPRARSGPGEDRPVPGLGNPATRGWRGRARHPLTGAGPAPTVMVSSTWPRRPTRTESGCNMHPLSG